MKFLKLHIVFLLFTGIIFTGFSQIQVSDKQQETINDISDASKEFLDYFFDALSQRAAEKNTQAIKSIEKCMAIDNSKPVLYYEYAQNEIDLKNFNEAKDYLEIALEKMPKSTEVLTSLAKVHFYLQNFDARIATLRKLSTIDSKFKYNLAQAYRYTQQYGEALEALNAYQSEYSYDSRIANLRNLIYTSSKDKLPVVVDLEKALQKNSKNEEAYVQLIDVYKKSNDENKAQMTITRFREAMPNSPMLEYIHFQDFIDKGDTVNATASLQKITTSASISDRIKKKVLKDYKIYSRQNPEFSKSIDSVASSKIGQNKVQNLKFFTELSNLQISQGASESLLESYQNNLDNDSNNYTLIKDTLLLQLYFGKTKKAMNLVEIGLEKYPSQPFLYLIKGTLLAKQSKYTKAITNYKDGLDYIVENPELERALYLKLAQSYEANGDSDKAKKYRDKGEKINISK